jgi:hypothetical protein
MKTHNCLVALILSCSIWFTGVVVADSGKPNEPVLFWVVIEQNAAPQFLAGDLHHNYITQLMHSAQAYGVNALLPMLDLSERLQLHEQDVAQFKWDVLLAASQRYNAKTIIAGRLKKNDEVWECSWQIYDSTQPQLEPQSWSSSGKDLAEQFVMVNETVAKRAQLDDFALEGGNIARAMAKEVVKVRITGIESLDVYSKVVEILQTLPIVSSVELNGLTGDEALFFINTDSDKYNVAQALAAQENLVINPNVNSNEYLEYKVNS